MRRREFIGLAAAACVAWPRGARTQVLLNKVWRIGIITTGVRSPPYEGFLQGLREHGYISGQDYVADWRFADSRFARFAVFAQEFVRLRTDVIFLGNAAAVDLVRQVTRTIPIVMGYSTDPVGSGYVTSLARPGGNVTGMASSAEDTAPRQLELLKAAVPNLSRVGLLLNPEGSDYSDTLKKTQVLADRAGLALVWVDARTASGLDSAFASFARQRAEALVVTQDVYFLGQSQRIADLALKHRLPCIYPQRDYVEAGGLMSYGESIKESYRRAASFVDRIFKGARAADLPIEQLAPQLVINRKAAGALGLAIPPTLSAQANEVIE